MSKLTKKKFKFLINILLAPIILYPIKEVLSKSLVNGSSGFDRSCYRKKALSPILEEKNSVETETANKENINLDGKPPYRLPPVHRGSEKASGYFIKKGILKNNNNNKNKACFPQNNNRTVNNDREKTIEANKTTKNSTYREERRKERMRRRRRRQENSNKLPTQGFKKEFNRQFSFEDEKGQKKVPIHSSNKRVFGNCSNCLYSFSETENKGIFEDCHKNNSNFLKQDSSDDSDSSLSQFFTDSLSSLSSPSSSFGSNSGIAEELRKINKDNNNNRGNFYSKNQKISFNRFGDISSEYENIDAGIGNNQNFINGNENCFGENWSSNNGFCFEGDFEDENESGFDFKCNHFYETDDNSIYSNDENVFDGDNSFNEKFENKESELSERRCTNCGGYISKDDLDEGVLHSSEYDEEYSKNSNIQSSEKNKDFNKEEENESNKEKNSFERRNLLPILVFSFVLIVLMSLLLIITIYVFEIFKR